MHPHTGQYYTLDVKVLPDLPICLIDTHVRKKLKFTRQTHAHIPTEAVKHR
jgi:hypothetical protein